LRFQSYRIAELVRSLLTNCSTVSYLPGFFVKKIRNNRLGSGFTMETHAASVYVEARPLTLGYGVSALKGGNRVLFDLPGRNQTKWMVFAERSEALPASIFKSFE
jgi:hypothetical protein